MLRPLLSFVIAALLIGGCSREAGVTWTTESGVKITELVRGEGAAPLEGDVLSVFYRASYVKDGKVFDDAHSSGEPLKFRLGRGHVLPGFDEGVATMRPGGKRIIVIPPGLAFGREGRPPVVPPNQWVKLEVELVEITPGPKDPLPWNDAGMEIVTTSSGLQYIDFAIGSGEFPKPGDAVIVHYNGFLDDGTLFDSSTMAGQPMEVELVAGDVLDGWLEGLLTMRAGGRRKLIVPPHLAYGEKGFVGQVPPNATLTFDIVFVDIAWRH